MRTVCLLVAISIGVTACRPIDSANVRESPVRSEPVQRGPSLIYVPAYAYVTPGRGEKVELTTTLTIHNVSASARVILGSVEYHDAAGGRVRSYLAGPRVLEPLEAIEFIVSDEGSGRGAGANFIVSFEAPEGGVAPLVEAVMVGNIGAGWLAFTSRGVVVRE